MDDTVVMGQSETCSSPILAFENAQIDAIDILFSFVLEQVECLIHHGSNKMSINSPSAIDDRELNSFTQDIKQMLRHKSHIDNYYLEQWQRDHKKGFRYFVVLKTSNATLSYLALRLAKRIVIFDNKLKKQYPRAQLRNLG